MAAQLLSRPWFLALDVDEPETALALTRQVSSWIGGVKVGPRLVLRGGPELVRTLAAQVPVFVDHKYYDIPSTMEHAVRATFEGGASFVTVHAAAGPEALRRLASVEEELNRRRLFRILAVTILTSFSAETAPPHWKHEPLADHVKALAQSVIASGLTGLVCSSAEVSSLRQQFPQACLVTPGVRVSPLVGDDQVRVETPVEALKRGASALVIGRPVVAAPDPVAAAREIAEMLQSYERKANG